MVCEGRKIVHVLNVGVIDSPLCFRKEVPTASYRIKGPDGKTKMKDSAWNSIVIPNGWKVAVVVGNDPWTAEVRITTKVEFRFVRVNRDGQEVIDTRSIWCETPGAAFKSLFQQLYPEKEVGRHNGKLYIGCHYDHVQKILRDYFKKFLDNGKFEAMPEIKVLVVEWIANKLQDIKVRKPKRGLKEAVTESFQERKTLELNSKQIRMSVEEDIDENFMCKVNIEVDHNVDVMEAISSAETSSDGTKRDSSDDMSIEDSLSVLLGEWQEDGEFVSADSDFALERGIMETERGGTMERGTPTNRLTVRGGLTRGPNSQVNSFSKKYIKELKSDVEKFNRKSQDTPFTVAKTVVKSKLDSSKTLEAGSLYKVRALESIGSDLFSEDHAFELIRKLCGNITRNTPKGKKRCIIARKWVNDIFVWLEPETGDTLEKFVSLEKFFTFLQSCDGMAANILKMWEDSMFGVALEKSLIKQLTEDDLKRALLAAVEGRRNLSEALSEELMANYPERWKFSLQDRARLLAIQTISASAALEGKKGAKDVPDAFLTKLPLSVKLRWEWKNFDSKTSSLLVHRIDEIEFV